MPFVARDAERDELVDITSIEDPNDYRGHPTVCPHCGTEMFPKGGPGTKFRWFWCHKPDAKDCPASGESPRHKQSKLLVRNRLRKKWGDSRKSVNVRMEVPVSDGARRIDVAECLPSGAMTAHEIQISPITLRELKERTKDYEQRLIPVQWYFGPNAWQEDIYRWCLNNSITTWCLHFGEAEEVTDDFLGER